MTIASLFQTLPKDGKLSRLGRNEYDFPINRDAKRIAGFLGAFATEVIRVRADAPYSWTGDIDVPDTSAGVLRQITCRAVVEGVLPASKTDLQDFLTLALRDRLDFDRLFRRALNGALTRCGRHIQNRFVEQLRTNAAVIHGILVSALQDEKLYATRVELRPIFYDAAIARDLSDDSGGVLFRTRDMLEQNRVGYKARLVWGGDLSQIIGRLAYRGAVEGKDPNGVPTPQLVSGQIQPAEAWFRQLLAEELGKETLADLLANNEAMLRRIRDGISDRLGPGTGRVVDSLVLHLLPGSTPLHIERPLQFEAHYRVAGIQGAGLKILHSIRYALEDRDRWHASGSTDPEGMLKEEVIAATTLFLNERRFEDVVSLYLDQRKSRSGQGDGASVSALTEAVGKRIAPIVRTQGHRVVSTSAILEIPQQSFIDGREIELDHSRYALAEPHLVPPMRLTAEVQIADGEKQNIFASALARFEDLEPPVKEAIGQTARATLRECTALEYFGSIYVNGLPRPLPPPVGAEPSPANHPLAHGLIPPPALDRAPVIDPVQDFPADPLARKLETALNRTLGDRFGLKLIRFDLTPGGDETDEIIDRMQELAKKPIPYPGPDTTLSFGLLRGGRDVVRLEAAASIFVHGPSPDYWSSFQYSVRRYDTIDDHVDEIRRVLTEALQMLQSALVTEAIKKPKSLLTGDLHNLVINFFTNRMQEQYGLDVRLHPLTLMIVRPKVDQSSSMMVESLHQEIKEKLDRRARTTDGYERDTLTSQIEQARKELETEAERLEREINQVEAVQVSQNLITGVISHPQLTAPILQSME